MGKKHKMDKFDGFKISLYKDEEGDWLAYFIEMPNISGFSDTPENAIQELETAWKGVKESYHKHNEPVPQAKAMSNKIIFALQK